jgi:hypothetical protein
VGTRVPHNAGRRQYRLIVVQHHPHPGRAVEVAEEAVGQIDPRLESIGHPRLCRRVPGFHLFVGMLERDTLEVHVIPSVQ